MNEHPVTPGTPQEATRSHQGDERGIVMGGAGGNSGDSDRAALHDLLRRSIVLMQRMVSRPRPRPWRTCSTCRTEMEPVLEAPNTMVCGGCGALHRISHREVELDRLYATNPKSAAEDAFDKIAELCGCPEWDYPGQVVRDVRRVVAALAAARAELVRRTDFANSSITVRTLRARASTFDPWLWVVGFAFIPERIAISLSGRGGTIEGQEASACCLEGGVELAMRQEKCRGIKVSGLLELLAQEADPSVPVLIAHGGLLYAIKGVHGAFTEGPAALWLRLKLAEGAPPDFGATGGGG